MVALLWVDAMKHAIDYLERHLEDDIDMNAVARAASSSKFHFQRMFHIVTGVTVMEYVRRRRLTLAAQDLATTKAKVIDIALKYRYETPESFAKAFQKMHGVTPSVARQPGVQLKSYPPLTFHITLKGDKNMDYKMIKQEAFQVVGKSIRVSTKFGENFTSITALWEQSRQDGLLEQLERLAENDVIYGICMDFDLEHDEFSYMIAIQKPKSGAVPAELEVRDIPASTSAVFECEDTQPQSIRKVWERIFTEWTPATGYEHEDAPQLEVYDFDGKSCDIWIPVVEK